MRIDKWPVEKIMQLPDWVFGRRFLISASIRTTAGGRAWDISEIAFPERAVIWDVRFSSPFASDAIAGVRVALGDQLPTSEAMMTALEGLLPGLGAQGPDPRVIRVGIDGRMELMRLRFPIAAAGRRLVLEVLGSPAKQARVTVVVVVSSMPKEIPDWLSW